MKGNYCKDKGKSIEENILESRLQKEKCDTLQAVQQGWTWDES